MERAGFKEWALVCEAIERGEQCLLLRKGGIAEGRDGFAFREREFFLFPTFFHEQAGMTRGAERAIPARRAGEIVLRVFAKVECAGVITSWETALALEPFHILRREVVRERFEYDDAPGIHLAFIRAYRLAEPWIIPERPAYGGCRSWVKLPEPAKEISLVPVLSDDEHARRLAEVQAIVAPATR